MRLLALAPRAVTCLLLGRATGELEEILREKTKAREAEDMWSTQSNLLKVVFTAVPNRGTALRLLHLAGFPQPVAMERVGYAWLGEREVPWDAFVRQREGDERGPANGKGYGFRIRFLEPVQGQVAVGYGEHFGMGGFEG